MIRMNQRAYIKRLAEKYGVDKCKDVHTPVNESEKLIKRDEGDVFVTKWPYHELVGALKRRNVHTTRHVLYAMGEVAKYCERHGKQHWVAAKRVHKYLTTTVDYSIVFNGKSKGELLGYADNSWGNDLDSCRSRTGYVFLFDSSVISRK